MSLPRAATLLLVSRGLFNQTPAARPTRFARVVLERAIDAPDGFTYSAPDSMPDLAVGERVAAIIEELIEHRQPDADRGAAEQTLEHGAAGQVHGGSPAAVLASRNPGLITMAVISDSTR